MENYPTELLRALVHALRAIEEDYAVAQSEHERQHAIAQAALGRRNDLYALMEKLREVHKLLAGISREDRERGQDF